MRTTPFFNEDFLLTSDFSRALYHDYVKDLPIIDYHNHLNPEQIANNTSFENITQVWLNGDHYKWRALRAMGVDEAYITGKASDYEKFEKWAEVLPYTLRNPLFHWSNLELKRYFGISELLTPETAKSIYETANSQLKQSSHTTLGLLHKQKVEVVCTTDDPADTLEHHGSFAAQKNTLKLLPTFRPDNVYNISDVSVYSKYINKLSKASNVTITSFSTLMEALENRIEFFNANGCRLSDHGMEALPYPKQSYNLDGLFQQLIAGQSITDDELEYFKFSVLIELSRLYHKKGWTQQFHLGVIRNNNTRLLTNLGPDTGFDSISDAKQAVALSNFLNILDGTNQLAKTILYNLNPAFNEVFATMVGNFNDGTTKGKVQYGAAWWFLDQKDGIRKHLDTVSNMGVLSSFVGMLTDSRSFLSFPRHEYFRRILCELFGKDIQNGELPNDLDWIGKIVTDISYNNAKSYFDF